MSHGRRDEGPTGEDGQAIRVDPDITRHQLITLLRGAFIELKSRYKI